MKHSRILYGLLAVLGIVFLPTVFYWGNVEEEVMLAIMPSNYILRHQVASYIGWFFWIGGIVLLTAGICGIGRQTLKNSKDPNRRRSVNSFTIAAILLVPSITFVVFIIAWLSTLQIGY